MIDNKPMPFWLVNMHIFMQKKTVLVPATNTATLQRAKNYLNKIICLQFVTYRQENSIELNP